MSKDIRVVARSRRPGSARDVAKEWRRQYEADGEWGETRSGPAKETYDALLAIAARDDKDMDAVDATIGNKSWTRDSCYACSARVTDTVVVESAFGTFSAELCATCARRIAEEMMLVVRGIETSGNVAEEETR